MPVLIGAAGLALSAGWKLLNGLLTQAFSAHCPTHPVEKGGAPGNPGQTDDPYPHVVGGGRFRGGIGGRGRASI